MRGTVWTSEEDFFILVSIRLLGTQYEHIATQLVNRTGDGVRNRWNRLRHKYGLGDGGEGDTVLEALLIESRWCPATMGLPLAPAARAATAGSAAEGETTCALLESDASKRRAGSGHGRSLWTDEEDRLIEEGVRLYGCKWRQITAALPGRSDSSVRNRWMRIQADVQKKRELQWSTTHASAAAAAAAAAAAIASISSAGAG